MGIERNPRPGIQTMAKDSGAEMAVEDGGDNSDCSLEEIPPESYFKHRSGTEGGRFRDSQRSNSSSNASCRVWHGEVMQQYHPHVIGSNFTSNLYSFAWAQAVQNKPLGFTEMASATRALDLDDDDNEEREKVGQNEDFEESNKITEKEEGELEEGEIDDFESSELEFLGERRSDSSGEKEDSRSSVDLLKEGGKKEVASVPVGSGDPPPPSLPVIIHDKKEKGDDIIFEDFPSLAMQTGDKEKAEEIEEELENFDMRVIVLLEELENLSEETVEKSFEEACSRLWKALQNLQEMVAEGHLSVLEAVIQQAFIVVNTIYSVFLKGKEQHKDVLARFLMDIKSQEPKLFASEEMKEIDAMIKALGPDRNKIMSGDLLVKPKPVTSSGKGGANDGHSFFKSHKLEPLNLSRNRLDFRPLLDPHANHDEGSLPSPTSGGAAPSLFQEATPFRDGTVTSQQSICRHVASGGSTVLAYETDAVRAVCNYQQKYDRISYISNNQLPSPTPSEETNDDKDDSYGEVSSSVYVRTARTVPSFGMVSIANSGSTRDLGPGFHGYKSNEVVKASAKSRDPRLRNANSNIGQSSYFNKQPIHSRSEEPSNGFPENILMDSRKQKFSDGHSFNNQCLKKPRNDYLIPRDSSISSDKGGLLQNNSLIPPTETSGNACALEFVESMKFDKQEENFNSQEAIIEGKPLQTMNFVKNASLPSLLKDIAVNPTMLLQVLMEQQKLMAESLQKTVNPVQGAAHSSSTNIPAVSVSSAGITLKPPAPQIRPDGKVQTFSHSAAMSEPGKVRMKSRDPRRFLHNNLPQKVENSGPEQLVSGWPSSITTNSKDLKVVREQGERSCVALPPDTVSNFTKKFMNSSDIASTMQPVSVRQMVPQSSSQLVRENTDEVSAGQRSPAFTSEANMKVTSVAPNPWGDVGHLLDGYDDQQKAAIQRERARRIEEQSKMFAARKLCLVLDLDHTLLNSAKFSEVDLFHDEILKKKEEQDRDQPQRHLFRFQHMAMWTKLRPGVWNFLEKASKRFELHLYTMGNNLYATEMAKVLDPKGTLFSGRVISKGDDGDSPDGDDRMPKSKDLEGVLGMESAVVIVDDSIKVWPHHKLNLIVVERYTYFPSSRRQFGLLGPSLLEIDHDERPEDGTLASSLAVIERVHQNFFSHSSLSNVDVRNILAAEQRKILGGCRIVFSRIFPVGEMNPHLHPLWQTAEQFGATCTKQIDDQVTHVVANSLGTDKVNWALSIGRFVVHPGWVEASALLYRRANEHDFAVNKL